jgi:hypothetical protein
MTSGSIVVPVIVTRFPRHRQSAAVGRMTLFRPVLVPEVEMMSAMSTAMAGAALLESAPIDL